ncbi:hypothetical protein MMC29_008507, partial [Sticta canariensis]|nr:hypothetical protein [Sticta canariensis]
MVVTTIYLTRHGFRVNWTLNPATGTYYANIPSPTNIPSDPPLAAYGVQQSHQLATALAKIENPQITQVYSSPFYRCLQTIQPFIDKLGGEME